jgi:hypothetical protein
VCLNDRFCSSHRIRIALAVHRVGFDQILSDATVWRRCSRKSRRPGTRARTAPQSMHSSGWMYIMVAGFVLGLVLARVDAVHRADVDAGGVFGLNTRVGDDEGHARDSPSVTLKM